MEKTVRLRHAIHHANRVEFLYDGLYIVHDGVVEVPAGNEVHARTMMLRGYNCKDDGTRLWTTEELHDYLTL